MSQYDPIDPLLSRWAEAHSLTWLTDYQGTDVRTFFLGSDIRDRTQIWVDPPRDDRTVVHAFQNRKGTRPKRIEDMPCAVSELPDALDRVLELVRGWLGQGEDKGQ